MKINGGKRIDKNKWLKTKRIKEKSKSEGEVKQKRWLRNKWIKTIERSLRFKDSKHNRAFKE